MDTIRIIDTDDLAATLRAGVSDDAAGVGGVARARLSRDAVNHVIGDHVRAVRCRTFHGSLFEQPVDGEIPAAGAQIVLR